jgi:integrase
MYCAQAGECGLMGGNTKGRRRRFGAVRQLRSGKWQARYLGPDGVMRSAGRTFTTKTEAERWLSKAEADLLSAEWVDPDSGKIDLESYAASWIDERANLRPKTVQLYRYLARNHLMPQLGNVSVNALSDAQVRRWRRRLLDAGVSPVTTAKAYRLLKAIFNTAVDDGLIRRNPCRIRGGGQERSPERPTLTIADVYRVANSVDPKYRALVLLAAFGSLRWGELVALQRDDIDLLARTVRIERQLTEVNGVGLVPGPPKSAAGRRVIHLPTAIVAVLREHLESFGNVSSSTSLVFTSARGLPLRHSQFRNRVWLPALAEAGLKNVHFHDLRHAGNDLAAGSGATLRELMARMGHSTARAALIYLHDSDDRQRKIADNLDVLLSAHLSERNEPSS